MKKFISIFMSALMLCGVLSATAFANEESTEIETSDAPVLELEYMDFYENEDYYMNLVEEKGYILHYNVPAEYDELECERIAKNAAENTELVPSLTRGTSAPTKGVSTTGGGLRYSFAGHALYSTLYTDTYYTGATHYVVNFYNRNYLLEDMGISNGGNLSLQVRAYNVVSSMANKTIGNTGNPNGTGYVVKYAMNGNSVTAKNARFYLSFSAPVYAAGYIRGSSAN